MTLSGRYWPVMIQLALLFFGRMLYAQPYFDVAGLSGWKISGLPEDSEFRETYGLFHLSLPVNVFNYNKVIVAPYAENRDVYAGDNYANLSLTGTGVPVTWLHVRKDSSMMLSATIIPRFMSTRLIFNRDNFQLGGAVIHTIQLKKTLKLRYGLYYNREFFGDYFIPLAGIDARFGEKWALFGVLPGNLKAQCQLAQSVFVGMTFKSITSSYKHYHNQGYIKLNDNHFCLFGDFYLPGNLACSVEAGHSLWRKVKNRSIRDFPELKRDGIILKAGIYYRIRLE
jgi:hypothetical protein